MKTVKFLIILFFFAVNYFSSSAKLYADNKNSIKLEKHASQGKIVFSSFKGENWDLFMINPDGSGLIQLTNSQEEEKYPVIFPDGKKLAYATNQGEIWLREMGKESQKLGYLPENCTHPTWLPDVKKITFAAYTFKNRIENSNIWIADLEKGSTKKLIGNGGIKRYPAWSPDGMVFIYSSGFRGEGNKVVEDLWIADASGGNSKILVSNKASNIQPAWSPDGEWIAFASDQVGNMDIWLIDRLRKNLKQLTKHKAYDSDPCWSPDGSHLCFVSTRSGKMDIWIMDRNGENPRQLTDFKDHGDSKEPEWSKEFNH